jgi:DNA-binding LytR/AlgR family response regulator
LIILLFFSLTATAQPGTHHYSHLCLIAIAAFAWQTFVYWAIFAVALVTLVYWIVQRRIKTIYREADLKHQRLEAEITTLRAQINSHFIFNCLNSIDSLIQIRIESLLHNLLEEKNGHARIAIPSIEGLLFIEVNDIIYLQAESNYTFIYLKFSTRLTVSKTLKDFEGLVPSQIFIRIHHSCLINKNHVQKYIRGEGGQVVMINGKVLDVARRKKEEFMRAIGC